MELIWDDIDGGSSLVIASPPSTADKTLGASGYHPSAPVVNTLHRLALFLQDLLVYMIYTC